MTCSVEGCDKRRYARGYCRPHYQRFMRAGTTEFHRKTNGHSKHVLYGAWAGMIGRCHNPNHYSYGRYGGIGVKVCDRWRFGDGEKPAFVCFLEDMGERPKGMTLDRIDPYQGYTPENCRWADSRRQRQNIRSEAAKESRVKGSKRMRSRFEKMGTTRTPFGEAIFKYCDENQISANQLAKEWGYANGAYLSAACVGRKEVSERLKNAARSRGIIWPPTF